LFFVELFQIGDCLNVRNFFLTILVLILGAAAFAQSSAAQQSAPKVELADDGIPILVKHLPEWESAQKRAQLATNLPELQQAVGNRAILETTEFIGGVEAVAANYDAGKLVIVEYPSAQGAIDADAKIKERLPDSPGTVYRKIGNYTVFVFDASDERAANSLLDKVTYDKEIQWLSDNPLPLLQAQRDYAVTSSDIILTTFKAVGIAVVAAIVFGGLFGAVIFRQRRRSLNEAEIFTDAGGMMRLNLDDLTPQTNPARLLEGK
jgi:hypothetical protein